MQVDFRSVYATILQSSLNFNATGTLEGTFPLLNPINRTCLDVRPKRGGDRHGSLPNRLQAALVRTGRINGVRSVRITRADDGAEDIGQQTGLGQGAVVNFPLNTNTVNVFVNRATPGSRQRCTSR
jgi:hypothetical protein